MPTKGPKIVTTTSLYDYIYGDYNSDGYDYIIDDFDTNQNIIKPLGTLFKQIYDITGYLSFSINFFHLFILTRKDLRTQNVYILMIGICVFDIFQALANLVKNFMTWQIVYHEPECYDGYRYSHLVVDVVAKCLQIMSRRVSSFLVLYMAVFRALALIFPFNTKVNKLMNKKFSYLIMLFLIVICGAWSLIYSIFVRFKQNGFCPVRTSYLPYALVTDARNAPWRRLYFVIDGYMSLFVSFSYILVAGALVVALRYAKRRRDSLGGPAKDFEKFDSFTLTLLIVNSTIHSILCFFLSSQYRDTVLKLFSRRGNRVEPFNNRVDSSRHPISE
ncbi:unnamed protein product [Caenorhabditis nigoni]